MRQRMKKEVLRQITAFFLVICMIAGLGIPGTVLEAHAESEIAASAFVHSGAPTTNYNSNANVIMGKGRHTYIRLNLAAIDTGEDATVLLKFPYAKNGGKECAFVIKPCSEYLRDGEKDSQTTWEKANINYNNRPLDLADAQGVTTEVFVPNTQKPLSLEVSELVKAAKTAGKSVLSLHITTDRVDTDTEAAEYKNAPYLEVTKNDTEPFAPVEPEKTGANYWETGLLSQKVFKMKGEDGKYIKLADNAEGSFTVTDNAAEAAVFSLYAFDYTAFEGASPDKSTYVGTTFGIRCLDNDKYLSIQNYFAADDTDKTYWNKRDYGLEIRACAPAVNWNERFYLDKYESGTYAIKMHYDLTGNRDAGVDKTPVRMGEQLYTSQSQRGAYKFTFEDVADREPTAPAEEKHTFTHPGIMHSQEELEAMKAHVAEKEEPWYSGYLKLRDAVPDNMSNPNFIVKAHEGVGRGNPAGSGNIGDFEQSGNAAYFNALQWVITGEDKYADASVNILNTWAGTLKIVDGRDRILGAAINSCRFINAAEILKYYNGGYSKYTDTEFKKFQDMLINVIYPVIEDLGAPMAANGNWDTAAMISMISIGVICENDGIYNRAVSLYHDIHVNGSIDVYVNDEGQSVESARDMAHAQLGIGYMADVCMVDKHQGGELYKLYDNRLAKAFNWAAQYNLTDSDWAREVDALDNVFGDKNRGRWTSMDSEQIACGELRPVYEVPLALYDGENVDLGWTEKAAQAMRAQGYVHNDNLNFGTLTTYLGDAAEACQPYFQIRTRLEPWYQRKKGDVSKYGTPDAESPYETLNSYFTVSETGELVASSKKATAPYFQLVRNEDDTYAVKCVPTGRYLSVKEEKAGDANIIKADAETVGPNEKFNYLCTGAARYYLTSPTFDNRNVYVYAENTGDPKNAVLTMRLGTNKGSSLSNNEILNIYYNTEEEAEKPVESGMKGIELVTPPSRTLYRTGEELDVSGLTVRALNKNGINRILGEEDYTLSGYDSSKEGKQRVAVTVKDPESDAEFKAFFPVEFDEHYIGRIQAEDFAEKTGNIYIRDNKEPVPGTDGNLILDGASQGKFVDFSDPVANITSYKNGILSGQDMATWKIEVPRSGFYRIAFRYNNPGTKWDGNRNARDERNCRIVVNNKENFLQSGSEDGWVGWMIFNVSGYNDSSYTQADVQAKNNVSGNTCWNTNYMNMYLEEGENELTLGIEAPPGQGVYDGPNLDCFDLIYIGDEYMSEDEIPYLEEGFNFTHPGIYYTLEDLAEMKERKDEEGSIYFEGFKQLQNSKYSKKDYTPQLTGDTYDVGPYNNPKVQADQFNRDMMASHYNALMWYFTGDKDHAKKAVEILNNLVTTVKNIGNGNDVMLRIPLVGIEAVNAAEILKYLYNESVDVTEEEKWQAEDVEAFDLYLREKLLAKTKDFYPQANGNWDALIGTFNMATAVYLEDVDLYNTCLQQFYIGNVRKGNTASMGSLLNYVYADGEAQESSRDQNHVQMGLSGLAYQCNIAWNQGMDLFEAYDHRLLKGVVYHSLYNMSEDVDSSTFISDKARGETSAAFEILYHHYSKYGDGISAGDMKVLEDVVEYSRTENKVKNNAVGENWNYYLAMIFAREGHSDIERPAKLTLVNPPAKTKYALGEELDLSGIKIVLTESNGSQREVDPEDENVEISEFDPKKEGEQEIIISYTIDGKKLSIRFTVEVENETYYTQKIEVTKKPNKTTYLIGEEFDPEGMEVTAFQKASKSNATRKSVLTEEDLEFDYNFDKEDKNAKVTISYEEAGKDGKPNTFETSLKVSVEAEPEEEDWYVSQIKITAKPKKLLYQLGETFDPEGMRVAAVWKSKLDKDKKREESLSADDYDCDYNFSEPGKKTVEVQYYGPDKDGEEKLFTAKLEVTVAAAAKEGYYTDKIAVTKKPNKQNYQVGDVFDRTGMEVTLYRVNLETGETEEQVITDYQVSPSILMTAGDCTVTISYASTGKDGKAKVFKDEIIVQVQGASGTRRRGSSREPLANPSGNTYRDAKKGMVNSLQGIITGTGDGYSNWELDGEKNAWKLRYPDNTFAAGSYFTDTDGSTKEQVGWEMVNGAWYAFGADGYTKSGFIQDYALGGFFYIDINRGMLTGWQVIDGRWYYFNPVSDGSRGRMLTNITTPDGYQVGADGVWIP